MILRNRLATFAVLALTTAAGTATAEAQAAAALPDSCKVYAQQFAAERTRTHPMFFQCAYDYAFGRCVAGGPSFISPIPDVVDCGHELCQDIYTLCLCGNAPPSWKRVVGLGC